MSDYLERDSRYGVVPELLGLDYRVSDRAFRVWYRLDRFAGDRGAAFPNRATLADELECSVATLDRAIEVLVETGWLTKKRKYAGGGNVYKLISHPTKANGKLIEAAIQAKADARKAKQSGDDVIEREQVVEATVKGSRNRASSQVSEGGVLTHEDTQSAEGGVLTHEDTLSSPMRTPLLMGEDSKDSSFKEASKKETPPTPRPGGSAADAAVDGVLALEDRAMELHATEERPGLFLVDDLPPEPKPTFKDFYAVFPRKKAPGAAEKAWDAAIKAGADPVAIVEGAARYAAERAGQDPTKTKYPQGWLNGKQWLDEPDTPWTDTTRQAMDLSFGRTAEAEAAPPPPAARRAPLSADDWFKD